MAKPWSKLKRDVESLFADSLKGRVGLHRARYTRWGLGDFREWIAIDGQQIVNTIRWRTWLQVRWERIEALTDNPDGLQDEELEPLLQEANRALAQECFFQQGELGSAMYEYVSMSIDQIVHSENVIIRALGMLDGRLGKRRLRALDVSNEPELVKILYAFRCHAENIKTDLSPEPRDVTPQLNHSRAELKRKEREIREKADLRLARSKTTREIPNLIKSIWDGAVDGGELDTAVSRVVYHGLDEAADQKSLGRYLLYIDSRSKLLETEYLAKGVIALMQNSADWTRPLEAWIPESHNPDRQFSSLARHLWAKYSVPLFMDKAWLEGGAVEQGWFKLLGNGGNIRTAADLPVPLTKMMAHHFLRAPATYSIAAAFRWAQVHALGGNQRLADALLDTRLVRDFQDNDFWLSVLRFFVNNPMLDTVHVNPIIDYIWHQRCEPRVIFVEPGVAEEIGPQQPNFSMHGRRVDTLLRAVDAWHRRLGRETRGGQFQWQKSDIEDWTFIEGDRASKNMKVWRIAELLSSNELVAEGRQMGHCVATYGHSCHHGRCSIWKMDVETEDGVEKALTIEVRRTDKMVRQIRGKYDRLATDEEKAVISRWAEQSGLTIASYLL
jgi:hypothetical protein